MRFVPSLNFSELPDTIEPWPRPNGLKTRPDDGQDDECQEVVEHYCKDKAWRWSGRRVYFFCDIHADADAFFLSLEASGGIHRTGLADTEFELSESGENALFIIGGDCFDKGPNNLRLLEAIHQLYLKGADIKLLAGNHDIRTFLGIYYAENKDVLLDHLFVRMGRKTVPFLKEIYDHYVDPEDLEAEADEAAIRSLLYPAESWFQLFPDAAKLWMPEIKLKKELKGVRQKTKEFEERVVNVGLDLKMVYLAVKKFRELFFEPEGRYYWFFSKMKLAHREGSYLFVHAGLDDEIAARLFEEDASALNKEFSQVISSDPFALYHGVLGNVFRTKYRDHEYQFTTEGVAHLHRAGIYAIVHGHRNILRGPRMVIREGMLNFECDASVDRNTRKVEGLQGPGAAAVIFEPGGEVKAISTDYPYIKSFRPTVTIGKVHAV